MPKRTKKQGLNFLLEYVTCMQFGGDAPAVHIKLCGDTLLLIGADAEALKSVSSKLTGGAPIRQYHVEQPTAKEMKVIAQQMSSIFNRFLPEPTTRRRLLPGSAKSKVDIKQNTTIKPKARAKSKVDTKLDTAVKPKTRANSNKTKVTADLKSKPKTKTKNRSKP